MWLKTDLIYQNKHISILKSKVDSLEARFVKSALSAASAADRGSSAEDNDALHDRFANQERDKHKAAAEAAAHASKQISDCETRDEVVQLKNVRCVFAAAGV